MSGATSGQRCQAAEGHCITCGDDGVLMQVISAAEGLALCSDSDHELHDVAVDLVEPVAVGDRLLVHAGVAIGRGEVAP